MIVKGILACWMIFMIYWGVSARNAKPIQRTHGWLRGSWHNLILLLGWIVMSGSRSLGAAGTALGPFTTVVVPQTTVVECISFLIVAAGLVVAITARRTLAGNWSSSVAIKHEHTLITAGLYRYVRHPIYTGMVLMFVGTGVLIGTLMAAIGGLISAVALWIKLHQEEAILSQHFAGQYLRYKQQTKRLLPFLW